MRTIDQIQTNFLTNGQSGGLPWNTLVWVMQLCCVHDKTSAINSNFCNLFPILWVCVRWGYRAQFNGTKTLQKTQHHNAQVSLVLPQIHHKWTQGTMNLHGVTAASLRALCGSEKGHKMQKTTRKTTARYTLSEHTKRDDLTIIQYMWTTKGFYDDGIS